MEKLAGVILAAGKGKRLGTYHGNKVLVPLFDKPLISYAVDILNILDIQPVVVVGYGREKVKKTLKDHIVFADQIEQLGTGHAVLCAMPYLHKKYNNFLVLMGDHCFALTPKLLESLILHHEKTFADITLLTVVADNIDGYGIIQRNNRGEITGIVDGKNIKHDHRKQGEITPGIYCFKTSFANEYLNKLPKHNSSGEYYLSDLVEVAYRNNKTISCFISDNKNLAIGINTTDDLDRAKLIIKQKYG